jgi:hypothetical protein
LRGLDEKIRIQVDENLVLLLDFRKIISDKPSKLVDLYSLLRSTIGNIFTNKKNVEVMEECSLIDPSIGLYSGHAAVGQLNGLGPNMVITPFIAATSFETWSFLVEESGIL